MGRPSTWDEEALLGTVMAVFRHHGYAQTSVRDLEAATGVLAGSLYKAYESKAGLFVAALRAYNHRVVEARIAQHLARADDPLGGIHSFFTSTFHGRASDPGCLVTNTAVECFTLGEAERAAVHDGIALIERGFVGALQRAVAARQLSRRAPIDVVARRLLASYQGLLVLVRSGASSEMLQTISDDAVTSLPAHPSRRRHT